MTVCRAPVRARRIARHRLRSRCREVATIVRVERFGDAEIEHRSASAVTRIFDGFRSHARSVGGELTGVGDFRCSLTCAVMPSARVAPDRDRLAFDMFESEVRRRRRRRRRREVGRCSMRQARQQVALSRKRSCISEDSKPERISFSATCWWNPSARSARKRGPCRLHRAAVRGDRADARIDERLVIIEQ